MNWVLWILGGLGLALVRLGLGLLAAGFAGTNDRPARGQGVRGKREEAGFEFHEGGTPV